MAHFLATIHRYVREYLQVAAKKADGDEILRLLLTAVVAIQSVNVANAATAGDPRGPVTEPSGAVELSPCDIPAVGRPARCGVLDVPENPDRPGGRRLSISVVVIAANAGPALPDPIVLLRGGPGEDAISAAALFIDLLAPLLERRDLLLVDQRGTGRSGALGCELYSADDPAASLRDLFPPAAVRRCERQLRARADLTQYTYAHFASDLEHVRHALGYGPLNLFAGSYGTRAAQVYIRTHPHSVRTVFLWSVVPIDVPTPITMAKTVQAAFESTLGACAADPACNRTFPELDDEFHEVFGRLASGSVQVAVPGRTEPAPIHGGRVAEWFRSMLYRPSSAVNLPWIVHRAHAGDWGPVVEGILSNARGVDSALSLGLFFSITCSEDIAYIREEDVAAATRGTVLGDYRLRQQQAACRHWPKVSLPAEYRQPVQSSVPALFVSGDSDAASPLWFTEHVAPGFSNRAEVILAGRGHTEWDDCVARIYEQFVRSGAVRGLEVSSCRPVPRPPFKTH
jgi:pimeloyl-ACP methyl ester carboxylesterase